MSPRAPAPSLFGDLRAVVVDEVHAFAGTDRGARLMSVLERLAALSRHDVQRIDLSATVGNPEQIARWLGGTSERERVVIDPPRPRAERRIASRARYTVVIFRELFGAMYFAAFEQLADAEIVEVTS